MTALVVLVPSPLLGPATWEPVRRLLHLEGVPTEVLALPADGRARPVDVVSAMVSALPAGRELVLVPHSNAGLYVPALVVERDVRGVVFVDAALPDDDGATPAAPAAFLPFLAGLADDDGLLPPWTQWWPPEDVAALFPDDRTRAQVEDQQPRLPLAYFRSTVPGPAGWTSVPCAYLAFGDTYAEEVARAQASGWPVSVLPGRHLHMLVAPRQVAAEVRRLLRAAG